MSEPHAPQGDITTALQGKPETVITLTDEQERAVATIIEWFKNGTTYEFMLGGYAGTGKTTVIKYLIAILRKNHTVVTSAFTGKACNVLHRKGVNAQTLHSLIYNAVREKGVYHFYRRTIMDGAPDIVIVDEASMLNTQLYNDLMSFKKKVLFVGDPGQLEPVGDNPELMKDCNIVLSKIHRQAEDSPIIKLANDVRLGGTIFGNETLRPTLIIKHKEEFTMSEALLADQIICARNKTRQMINEKIRRQKLYGDDLCLDEKLICFKNNSEVGVFNGMILFVRDIRKTKLDRYIVDLEDEAGGKYLEVPLWREPFRLVPKFNTKQPEIPKGCIYAEYGYAITCHKSQGSEWDNVLVYDEWMPPEVWDMRRWRYTAITRAAKQLTYCI